MKEEKEIIEVNKDHRIMLQKLLAQGSYKWFVGLQKKGLFGWHSLYLENNGWDAIYGYDYEKAKRQAENFSLSIRGYEQ